MDLGSAFAVSVARQPGQIAIVEGDRRVSYSDWYCEIKAVGGALGDMGLKPGDHFVAVMRQIARECEESPDLVRDSPRSQVVGRLDEVTAARRPILRWS